ncbi:helix-turn-helix domain-containing protein [Catellatospora sp. KI3]|uniref:helix-turn-helix domain-containing protein n=1 Tax=Catellatospora sp. KI3 TaxID=3041620 RepID=UPI0024832E2B|nr:helix-turn-helix domain-containing protein [Catellatospora sp. KI3]MDI1464299.1 helix-turn-helix domain-containing protein [Catellatospora sp. KI3]
MADMPPHEEDEATVRTRSVTHHERNGYHSLGRAGDIIALLPELNDPNFMSDANNRRLLVQVLAQIRRTMNLNQADLARRMNTTQSAVSEIEKGEKEPRLSTLQRYARALGLELQFRLSTSWSSVVCWREREIQYESSAVQPVSVEEGFEVWRAIEKTAKRHAVGRPRILPVTYVDKRDDHFVSDADILRLRASHVLARRRTDA